jgi:hypothetical protein
MKEMHHNASDFYSEADLLISSFSLTWVLSFFL